MKFIIFDLDDTLLCGDSERYWSDFMVKKGFLEEENHIKTINKFDEDYRNGNLDFDKYSSFILSPLKRKHKKELDILIKEFIPQVIERLSDNLTKNLLLKAKEADKSLIASGSLDFLVKGFANRFEIDSVIGTQIEIKDNIITGKLAGKASFREGKLELVKNWCSENNLNLGDAVFYSDSINDLPMFEACGKPIVVNPDEILRNLAVNRSYKIIER